MASKRPSHTTRETAIQEAKNFVIRVKTNDSTLRDALREAEAILTELEAAVARHDRTAERVLSYRASRALGRIQDRVRAIGATNLFIQLAEIDHALRSQVDRSLDDAGARRQGRYAGRIAAVHDGPNGEKYFEQDVNGEKVYHAASAFPATKPMVGQTVTVEYEDPDRAVVRATFQPTQSLGERTRVLTDTSS